MYVGVFASDWVVSDDPSGLQNRAGSEFKTSVDRNRKLIVPGAGFVL